MIALTTETLYPDLAVDEVIVAPTGVGGEDYTVQWTVSNTGRGDASGSWFDEIWLSEDPNGMIDPSHALRLGRVGHSKLDKNDAYQDSLTVTLSPSAIGSYIVVITDAGKGIAEEDETNNQLTVESAVTPRPTDLRIVDIQVPSRAKSGEQATVQFTVENTSAYPVWTGTDYWFDYVWISADVQFRADRASYLGSVVHANDVPLQPGEQYTAEVTGILPEGIGGDFFVYIHPDTHNERGKTVNTAMVACRRRHQ